MVSVSTSSRCFSHVHFPLFPRLKAASQANIISWNDIATICSVLDPICMDRARMTQRALSTRKRLPSGKRCWLPTIQPQPSRSTTWQCLWTHQRCYFCLNTLEGVIYCVYGGLSSELENVPDRVGGKHRSDGSLCRYYISISSERHRLNGLDHPYV